MIYFDPTESRSGTRLPESVISQGHELPGLESATAADILITTEPAPDINLLSSIDNHELRLMTQMFAQYDNLVLSNIATASNITVPAVIAAKRLYSSIQNGLLIQRKTGSDLLSLVPNYATILMKMLIWTDRPWLLFVGDLKCSSNGYTVIDGHESGFQYNSVIGCLESWQMGFQGYGGGFFTTLSRDALVAPWLSHWLDRLRNEDRPRLIPARAAIRPVIGERRSWVQTLATFPGIGPERAKALADHWGSLAACLEFLSDTDEWKREKVDGIGPGTISSARDHLGLTDKDLHLVVEMKGDQ